MVNGVNVCFGVNQARRIKRITTIKCVSFCDDFFSFGFAVYSFPARIVVAIAAISQTKRKSETIQVFWLGLVNLVQVNNINNIILYKIIIMHYVISEMETE